MAHETWGTYSVQDHMAKDAFLADLMLYDRLVLPVPEDNLSDDDKAAWDEWNPRLQDAFVRRMKPFGRVETVPWRIGQWQEGKQAFEDRLAGEGRLDARVAAAAARDAFLFTRTRLVEQLPPDVRGLTTVPVVRAKGKVAEACGFRMTPDGKLVPAAGGIAAAGIQCRFLVPEVGPRVEPDDLDRILEITSDSRHKRLRRSFWNWQRDFFGEDVILSQRALDEATNEIAWEIDEMQKDERWDRWKRRIVNVALVGTVSLGMLGEPLSLATTGSIAISVGAHAFEEIADKQKSARAPTAAVFETGRTDLPFHRP